ncbi:NAD+ synthase [Novosphingobium sp. 1949]|uniref:Glutamine-dependent NAD(+) synthetase n=1 Tax=Novosphingobium organovorum TaxID=2930092 RepID=A0ABT0BAN8_9SPHN|nr:NAD+ synthase [Novosphingobium organovorum]MCJ2182117.1 NAD+ synthase [Novosphingobium organovorum]
MPDALKIALGQLNQSVGDVAGNAEAILAARREAWDADLVVFPELHLIGYPPEDLILKPALVEKAAAELEHLAEATGRPGSPALLVGSAFVRDGALHNGVALLDQGRIAAVRFKHELPNYGTFDEMRLFQPGPLPEPVIVRGTMLGVPICEDIWRPEVCRHLADFGAEMFVCINGSPYEINKDVLRIEGVAKRRAVDTGLPLAYLNRVGGQDELVFDGASFVVNGDGSLAAQARDWEEQVIQTRWTRTAKGWRCDRGAIAPAALHPESLYCAIVLALRDFAERAGAARVALALDGSLDAALCAALAVDALGAERVLAVLAPIGDGESHGGGAGIALARLCASRLGIAAREVAGHAVFEAALEAFEGGGAGEEERLGEGVRGLLVAAEAERCGAMLLSAVNKTQLSVGARGDALVGRYAPLKDVYAGTVRMLAQWRNDSPARIGLGANGDVIPEAVLAAHGAVHHARAPYRALDAMLQGLVEQDKSIDQLVAEGFDRGALRDVEERLHRAEAARRQAPPGVKLTPRNFGRDRRYPVTHAFRSA